MTLRKINKTILDKFNANSFSNQCKLIEKLHISYRMVPPNKEQHVFEKFHIESFHTSILLNVFCEGLNFAKILTDISEKDMPITFQIGKTLFFDNSNPC